MLTLIKTNSPCTANASVDVDQKPNSTHINDQSRSNNDHVVTVLENLLRQARAGELTGLMYVVRLRGQDHGVGVAGHYLHHLASGPAAFTLVYSLLGEHLRDQQCR